ncbi:13578_t:CDS:2, partial [Acaulospora colombiana]
MVKNSCKTVATGNNTSKLLKIVKPEIRQNIIYSTTNPDIPKKRRNIAVEKKKNIHNYSSEEDIEEFWMESESDDESSSN